MTAWSLEGVVAVNWDDINPSPLPTTHYGFKAFMFEFGRYEVVEIDKGE